MPSLLTRRCTMDRKTEKTMYDTSSRKAKLLATLGRHYPGPMGAHEFNCTFFPAQPDSKGNIYYEKPDGTRFVANFIAEIGSEAQGTWMAAYPKKAPPASNLPYNDVTSKSHKMVLALRCPTGAPEQLCTMYRDGVAVCDSVRAHDEEREAQKHENFEIMDWISCDEGSPRYHDACSHPSQENYKGWVCSEPSHDVEQCG
ncbi:hypothetical protein B0H10DRAFT_2227648 [Mycena sp. CBHHK59/15]|nr:hypothetical protein B0H10DRAFT_2227648 [Mycena sp. CBHHK59/15]